MGAPRRFAATDSCSSARNMGRNASKSRACSSFSSGSSSPASVTAPTEAIRPCSVGGIMSKPWNHTAHSRRKAASRVRRMAALNSDVPS